MKVFAPMKLPGEALMLSIPLPLIRLAQYLLPSQSLPRLLEISQVRRRLVLAGRHQHVIAAQEINLLADGDQRAALGTIGLVPVGARTWVAHISFVHGPRPGQGMVDHGDFVMP